MTQIDLFPRDSAGLRPTTTPEIVRLTDGDRYDLRITPVAKRVGDATIRMLAYNGSIPGPTLHVDQGAEIAVAVTNLGDLPTTVHWHGIRLENRFDGVPGDTQAPIGIGQTYVYRVRFPDAGFYWYHPHLREDVGQELGMYGTIIVEPADAAYWPPADRQLPVTLDDILVEDGDVVPLRRSGPTFTAMGRFGNEMLVNGETELIQPVQLGEVVRLHLVNTANTRIFNVAIPDARMKLIGGDSGRYEREAFVDAVRLAPSERAIVDVRFDRVGSARIEHRTPDRVVGLGRFVVNGSLGAFDELRVDPELARLRAVLGYDLERAPDKVLAFVSTMPLVYGGEDEAATTRYACPMHPDITSPDPGRCPKCGMRLTAIGPAVVGTAAPPDIDPAVLRMAAVIYRDEATLACAMDPQAMASGPACCTLCQMDLQPIVDSGVTDHAGPGTGGEAGHPGHPAPLVGDGLEWDDLMPEINRRSDASNMQWCIVDRQTGTENDAISWTFTVGDWVKIRLVNELESDHPMHHPFHIHGAGRFLILARDGEPEANLVWKDTVLVASGQMVDILLEVTNPGRWMAHCHIAEHIESGMMFGFDVVEAPTPSARDRAAR